MQLRPYQVDALKHARHQNTIVNLPTGYGKTLIAVRLLDDYVGRGQRVALLVPTRAMVVQQAEYCESHSEHRHRLVVQRLQGDDQAGWTRNEWRAVLARTHVFVGTAALFASALVTDGLMSVSDFGLFIFDECHNCTGNSPMAAVMRDAIAPQQQRQTAKPRVLGLTASFCHGSMTNLTRKRQALEALMLSNIFCPDVPSRLGSDSYTHVAWTPTPGLEAAKALLEKEIPSALTKVGRIKEMTKVVNRCSHVLEELGGDCLAYYLESGIVQQLYQKASALEQLADDPSRQLARRIRVQLPSLNAHLQRLAQLLRRLSTPPPATSCKLKTLLDLLDRDLFPSTGQAMDQNRCIIFVEQVSLVSPLQNAIREHFRVARRSTIACGAVAGTGAQSETDRQAHLSAFRSGSTQILVATSSCEEGVDVPQCRFVIRYNPIRTTKGHIQGSGRARHSEAKVFYFENNPTIERQKESQMNQVAQNSALSLDEKSLSKSLAAMSLAATGACHPYPFGAPTNHVGVVNVFNCKQIFNQYCSMVLGESISSKKKLYTYAQTNAAAQGKTILRIRVPTPQCWKIVSSADVGRFWSGVDMGKVFDPARSKRKTSTDKDEMCFVYPIVIFLREAGLLGPQNRATDDPAVRAKIKLNCPVSPAVGYDIKLKSMIYQRE